MRTLVQFMLSFLTPREKKHLAGLMLLMILLAMLELAGFGSIFSYISLLTDPALVHSNRILASAYDRLHFQSERDFFLFLGAGVFLILIVRGLVSAANLYFQSLFTAHLRNRLSLALLGGYVRLPYVDFLSLNTAVLTKHLLEEVSNVISSVSTFLSLLTESIVSVTLVLLLLLVDPVLVLLVALSISLLTFGIVATTRKRISAIGRESELCSRKMFKSTAEVLGGFKDIRVCHSEGYFISKFEAALKTGSQLGVRLKMIAGLPGMLLNLGAFAMLLLTLLYLLAARGSIASALPVISLLALTVQRFLPSADKIFNAIGLIKKYTPGIEIVSTALRSVPAGVAAAGQARQRFTFERTIALEAIDFTYPGAHRKALSGVSLVIRKNSALGIIGSSGAGKSTLVDVLLGLLPVSSGRIVCDDKALEEANLNDFHSIVGYVPQQTFLLDDTIAANIVFGAPVDAARMEKAVRIAQLSDFAASLPRGLETEIGDKGVRISGGQRQRIGIARALYREPQILILDEATNALDSVTENSFNESLKNLMGRMTVIIIAHRYTTLKYCDAVVVMKEGRIEASGRLDDLAGASAEFRALYAAFSKGDPQ